MFLELLTLRMSITDSWIARATRSLDDLFTRRDPVERHPMADSSMRAMKPSEAAATMARAAAPSPIADTMALPVVTAGQASSTAVKTLQVATPTVELAAEIDEAVRGAMFTAEEMAQAISAARGPKTAMEAVAEDLPDLASTMALSAITLLPEDEPSQPLGTFISAILFDGCTDEECGACDPEEDGPAIVLNYIPDDDEDRSVCTIELQLDTRVVLEH